MSKFTAHHQGLSFTKCITLWALLFFFVFQSANASSVTHYRLQLGHFDSSDKAEQLVQKATALTNLPVVVKTSQHKKKVHYLVETKSFTDKSRLKPLVEQCEKIHIVPTIITSASKTVEVAQAQITPPEPKSKPAHKQDTRLWNLRDADIRTVIAAVSRETGKNFIIDPRVQGRVSIISNTPLKQGALYQVFLTMLQTNGYTAIPSYAGVIKIMPSNDSRSEATPIATELLPKTGATNVVRVIPVKNVSAEQLVPVLRPLLPQWASISAYPPSNTLILTGHANNLERLNKIIQSVDQTSEKNVTVVPLKHAQADSVVRTLETLAAEEPSRSYHRVKLAADDRSNAILIRGPRTARIRMRVLIANLDKPRRPGAGNTQVIYLRYMQARDIVPILAGVAKSNYDGPVGTVIGTRSDQDKEQGSTELIQDIESNIPDQNYAIPPGAQARQLPVTQQTSGRNTHKPPIEIIGEPNTNSVILNAPPTVMKILKNVIAKVDIRPAQVLVEAIIAEISEDEIKNLGIQWGTVAPTTTGAPAVIGVENFQQGVGIISRDVIKNNFQNYQAVIRALSSQNKADILSTPSVMVLDNHQAKIVVGQRVSIQESTQPSSAGGTTVGTPYATFGREDVALKLFVTPQINQGESVLLKIIHENDTLRDPNDVSTTPTVNKSSIRTSVLINSGDVLVLGGLIQNQLNHVESHIPFLGQIPIVGDFFKDRSQSHMKKNLMVFLRPVIINNPLQGLQVTNDKYHFTRQTQLDYLRKHEFVPNSKDLVLPRLHKQPHLPHPFTGHPMILSYERTRRQL